MRIRRKRRYMSGTMILLKVLKSTDAMALRQRITVHVRHASGRNAATVDERCALDVV